MRQSTFPLECDNLRSACLSLFKRLFSLADNFTTPYKTFNTHSHVHLTRGLSATRVMAVRCFEYSESFSWKNVYHVVMCRDKRRLDRAGPRFFSTKYRTSESAWFKVFGQLCAMRFVVGEYVCAKSKLIEAVLRECGIYVGFAKKSSLQDGFDARDTVFAPCRPGF